MTYTLLKTNHLYSLPIKESSIYLQNPFAELDNIRHVKHEIDRGIYHEHKMAKDDAVLNMCIESANSIDGVSSYGAYKLVKISNNREKLTKHKYASHS